MRTEIFGEGITYIAEPPEEEGSDEPEEGAPDAEGDYDVESEFVDEPVDDADVEDDD